MNSISPKIAEAPIGFGLGRQLPKPAFSAGAIRVLMVCDHLGHPDGKVHGGTTYFINHLPKIAQSVSLKVVFLSKIHPAAGHFAGKRLNIRFLGRSKWDAAAYLDIQREIDSFSPDLLHLHGEKAHLLGRIAARRKGIPTCVHLHDAEPVFWPLRPLQRRLSSVGDSSIVVSEQIRYQAVAEYGFAPDHVHTIEYGIDLSPFELDRAAEGRRIRDSFNIPANSPVVIVVGRINQDKGQAELIANMPTIIDEFPELRLLVVGDGPDLPLCRRIAEDYGIQDSVVFAGQRSDIAACFSIADVVAVPSVWTEAFGFVALEGIASGKPVVAFKTGGIPSIVLHKKNGLLVPRADFDAFWQAISILLSDQDKRENFGSIGREYSRRFSLDKHAAKLLRLYRKIVFASKPGVEKIGQ